MSFCFVFTAVTENCPLETKEALKRQELWEIQHKVDKYV